MGPLQSIAPPVWDEMSFSTPSQCGSTATMSGNCQPLPWAFMLAMMLDGTSSCCLQKLLCCLLSTTVTDGHVGLFKSSWIRSAADAAFKKRNACTQFCSYPTSANYKRRYFFDLNLQQYLHTSSGIASQHQVQYGLSLVGNIT